MKLGPLVAGLFGAGLGILAYGALVESKRLVLERRRIHLRGWPARLNGYRIAVLADLHLRDRYSVELGERAVAMALDADPDMVAIAGDVVGYWKPESAAMIGQVLEPLLLMEGNAVAVPGNHEYWGGDVSLLAPILDELNIRLLRNESWVHHGIRWVGIDSANAGMADVGKATRTSPPYPPLHPGSQYGEGEQNPAIVPRHPASQYGEGEQRPTIVLWHEPDLVGEIPPGAALQISGHSHGGQFRLPTGWAPMHTENGRRYREGFYPDAPTPLYVSRGVGTTGPPSRLFCPPEVSVLEIFGERES